MPTSVYKYNINISKYQMQKINYLNSRLSGVSTMSPEGRANPS